jgi:cardiolipin synthase A/B
LERHRRSSRRSPGPSSSRRELLDLIDSAQKTLDIYAEVVRDQEIVDALTGAVKRGVHVRVIVPEERDEDTRKDYFDLIDQEIEIRTLPSLYEHAKLVVTDDQRAFIGSQNFTATSMDQNRELGILVNDPALISRLDRTFETDFSSGRPFS